MAEPVINFSMEWRLVPTTCEPCTGCQEIIYGKQYQLFLNPGGSTEKIICESCYSAIAQPDS